MSRQSGIVSRGRTLKLGHLWVQKLGTIGRFKERFCVLTTNKDLAYYQKQEVRFRTLCNANMIFYFIYLCSCLILFYNTMILFLFLFLFFISESMKEL